MELKRKNFFSGAPLEQKVGYSRLVKVGPFVYIGGTTSVQPDGSVLGKDDGYEQTKYVLEKMIKCLEQAGGKKEDVIRVKIYTTNMSKSKEYLKAYSEFFKEIKPLSTLVGISQLNRPDQLVEIEMDAILGTV